MTPSHRLLGILSLVLGMCFPHAAHAIADGTYQIVAKHSDKCVDVSGASGSNGAIVHQWRCHSGDNQKWQVLAKDGGYRIQAVHSSKCLDVSGVSTADGAMMQQWRCGSGANQRFHIERQSDGSYRIRPMHSGKVVEVGASSAADGANVKQWRWWGGDSQRFAFRKTNTPTAAKAVWNESFDGLSAGSRWFDEPYTEIRNGCGVNGSKCVRMTYVRSSVGSPRIVAEKSLPPAREYTLNYDVMFENGFEFIKGGKLPGLGPNRPTAGCAPIVDDGWSARVMWRRDGEPVIYSYHQNRAKRCGDDFHSSVQFQTGRYQAISLHVKVNDPWSANGLIDLYIDGRKVASHQNVQLREVGGSQTEITKFLLATFFGGSDWSWAPPRTVYARFDNFAVYPGLRVRGAPGR
ncbi:RICIN domain-containing protein [Allohahella sp. A8]|uniref:RICIN domain-containing protein n=1 Tax=Allohahella sp. A8 TaxID=3141461 RepID=UPI0026B10A03